MHLSLHFYWKLEPKSNLRYINIGSWHQKMRIAKIPKKCLTRVKVACIYCKGNENMMAKTENCQPCFPRRSLWKKVQLKIFSPRWILEFQLYEFYTSGSPVWVGQQKLMPDILNCYFKNSLSLLKMLCTRKLSRNGDNKIVSNLFDIVGDPVRSTLLLIYVLSM